MAKRMVLVLAISILALSGRLLGDETVTLPVAASTKGVGDVPFVSDVRVFNTSYSDTLSVTAVYRFNGATQVFQLAPREAKAFDNIGVSLFNASGSVGAIEFTATGNPGSLVVSSQLRSPMAAGGFVGMFIPGLPSSAAQVVTVLTGLVNGPARTNVGVYNPGDNTVTATIRLYDGAVPLGTKQVQLGGHSGTQLSNIYDQVGFGTLSRTNGYATVESSDSGSPLFTYAAEADNTSGDLILVVGARDATAPAGFHPPTATTTPGGPAPTPTPHSGSTVLVDVALSGTTFSPGVAVVHVGDTVQWNFHDTSNYHSTTSGTCVADPSGYGGDRCTALSGPVNWDSGLRYGPYQYPVVFTTAGSYRYYCDNHRSMMTGTVQVNP